MRLIPIVFCVLLTSLLFTAGCASKTGRSPLDPALGWKFMFSQDRAKLPKAILEDYRAYLDELPPAKRSFIEGVQFFEDGNGQHAVDIKQGINGTYWEHILIYDRDNKRIRVVKYRNGGYRS